MVLFLKNLLFTVAVPGTAAVYVPLLLIRHLAPAPTIWRFMSLPFFLIGPAIYLWCVWDFATFGRGTPAPVDAPKRLVVRGLYRYTRNPMYVGVLTTVAGWVIRNRSLSLVLYAAALWLCFQLFVLFYEEPHLSRVFGSDYTAYRAQVGRWLPQL
jgi:protein-S-isoprenylcysteine O-methyltransferase Ste14